MAELTRTITVICNSEDVRSHGSGDDFRQQFGTPILSHGERERWEVAFLELDLSGAPTTDVLVYTDIIAEIPVGSQTRKLLRAIPKSEFNGSYYRAAAPIEWRALDASPPLLSAAFTLADWNGNLVPTTSSKITLIFRQAGNLH